MRLDPITVLRRLTVGTQGDTPWYFCGGRSEVSVLKSLSFPWGHQIRGVKYLFASDVRDETPRVTWDVNDSPPT